MKEFREECIIIYSLVDYNSRVKTTNEILTGKQYRNLRRKESRKKSF